MTQATETTPATTSKPAHRATETAPAKTKPIKATKADAVISLLSRARGATLDEMMTATGWQAHSVRGFLSGALKKKLGSPVTSEKTPKGRVYRLGTGAAE